MNLSSSRTLLVIAGLILALAQAPYIVGWWLSSDDQIFSGVLFFHGDTFSYYAKMREGFEGLWLYENRYTTEPTRPALLFTFYLALGHLARWTGLAIPLVYHLARTVSGAALLWAILRWSSLMRLGPWGRLFALLLGGVGSGLGWLVISLGITGPPPDEWCTDAYSFASMLNFPHFTLSMALLAHALADLMKYVQTRESRPGLLLRLGLLVSALAWVHPRIVITLASVGVAGCAIGTARGLWNWKRPVLPIALVLISGGIPCFLITQSYAGDPIWEEWAATRINPMAIPWLMEAYGLMWPLAALALPSLIRRKSPWRVFLFAWSTIGIVLAYLPFPLLAGSRMLQGYGIALGLLAADGLSRRLIPRIRKSLRDAMKQERRVWVRRYFAPLLALAVCVIATASSIQYVKVGLRLAQSSRYPMYYSHDRADMMAWLRSNTPADAVILSAPMTALAVPALSGRKSVVGHWAETHRRLEKEAAIAQFYDANTLPEQRDEILKLLGGDFIVQGMFEYQLGAFIPDMDPTRWELVWEQNGMRVFRRI